jgi:predicted SprT family Zn-dependent metalloprotease
MIKKIRGLYRCAGGTHERSERHIVADGSSYISRCAHCGVRMRRRAKRDWIVEKA